MRAVAVARFVRLPGLVTQLAPNPTWLPPPLACAAHIGRVWLKDRIKSVAGPVSVTYKDAVNVVAGHSSGLGRGDTHYEASPERWVGRAAANIALARTSARCTMWRPTHPHPRTLVSVNAVP